MNTFEKLALAVVLCCQLAISGWLYNEAMVQRRIHKLQNEHNHLIRQYVDHCIGDLIEEYHGA